MSTDHDDRTGGGPESGDPLRDLLLGLATQIDHLAAWVGGASADPGAAVAAGGMLLRESLGAEVAGEITTLMREIGDLLARLIAALIAVLEAIAAALRSSPTTTAPAPRRYQPIEVRFDVAAPRAETETGDEK
ncbi:hypothetical protein [Gordonia sp. NPDC003376]